MMKIARDILIETKFSGIVVGFIRTMNGQILIDAPFRTEDIRTWRNMLAKAGGGEERILINLDTHLDRTIGIKSMESVVIAHQKSTMMMRSRSTNIRSQENETIAQMESFDGLGSIRWTPPDITFENTLYLNLGTRPVILEHHAGANAAGVWVILPEDKVVFVGDTVLVNQPPFLGFADMAFWLQDLKLLLSSRFKYYQIVSGRNGLVSLDDVREMSKLIRQIHTAFVKLKEKNASTEEIIGISLRIIKRYSDQPDMQEVYINRLRWGLGLYNEQYGRQGKSLNTVSHTS